MKELPKIFRKFGPQILYFAGVPAFFISFVLLYRPFDIDTLLDMGAGLYPFNITMTTCIMLVIMVASRLTFYFMRHRMKLNRGWYIFWCLMEIVVMSHFISLYLWLMYRHTHLFFEILVTVMGKVFAILIFPYLFLGLALELSARSNERAQADDDENSRIRFYDEKQTLKFVVAASAILYIEAEENYVRIYYTDSGKLKNYLLRNSMKNIEELCQYNNIIRCHRSFYINSAHIKVLRKDKEGIIYAELDMPEAKRIPVTKRYYDQLSNLL